MADEATTLPQYYARMDGRAQGDPLALVADDARFSIVRPDATFDGGKQDLRHYVENVRSAPRSRVHRVLTSTRLDDLEFVVGEIVDDGETVPGPFLSLVQVADDGTIRRYLAVRAPGTFDLPQ